MKITELLTNQAIIIQFIWGEQKIEIHSTVVRVLDNGIQVTAYIHDGKPLEFDIDSNAHIVCNVFADDPNDQKRISWKNVTLKTQTYDGQTVYFLGTNGYNNYASVDDRRRDERIRIQKEATLSMAYNEEPLTVTIEDISDVGVAFHAPKDFLPSTNQMTLHFADFIGTREFRVRVHCQITRAQDKAESVLYGCKIMGDNKDYLLYGCLKRLAMKKKKYETVEQEA